MKKMMDPKNGPYYKKSIVTFRPDGSALFVSTSGAAYTGTWEFHSDSNRIVLKFYQDIYYRTIGQID